MDGSWGGQDVSRVAEGWEVAHRCHMSGQGSSAKGGGLLLHTLGQLLKALCPLLVLLGLVGHLAVSSLDPFLLHGQWPIHLGATTKPLGSLVPFPKQDPSPCFSLGTPPPNAHHSAATSTATVSGRVLITVPGLPVPCRALPPINTTKTHSPHFYFILAGPSCEEHTTSQPALSYGSPFSSQAKLESS